MIVATKYSLGYRGEQQGVQLSNFDGTGSKSLLVSFEARMKNLQTDHVGIVSFDPVTNVHWGSIAYFRQLYVHNYDYSTDITELMQSLNILVRQRFSILKSAIRQLGWS